MMNKTNTNVKNPVEKNNSGDMIANSGENDTKSGESTSGETPPSVIIKEDIVKEPEKDVIPVKAEYDVIVFGAEPEGVVTAISAARNGLKVLLVEKRDGPGGIMTYAMLNTIDMNKNTEGTLLSKGIFEEL